MRWRALTAVPVLLAVWATTASAQIRPQEPPPIRPFDEARRSRTADDADDAEETERGDRYLDIALSSGAWVWLSHFRAETPTSRFEITGPTTFDSRLAITVPIYKQLELELAGEYALGSGTSTWVVGFSAALRLDLFDEWGGMLDGELRPRLGFVAGGFDWDNAPGSFDMGFGAEFGVELAVRMTWLPDAWWATLELDLRSLTFEFDPDPGVVDTDSVYGGFGIILRLGLRIAI